MARGAHARDRPTYHAIANIKIAATAAAMPCLTCTRSEPGSKPGKKSGSASAGTNQYKMATKANANPKISATTRICTPRISDRPRHIDQTRAGSILVNCVSDWHCQAPRRGVQVNSWQPPTSGGEVKRRVYAACIRLADEGRGSEHNNSRDESRYAGICQDFIENSGHCHSPPCGFPYPRSHFKVTSAPWRKGEILRTRAIKCA